MLWRKIHLLLLLTLAVAASASAQSLHPLFTDKDLVFESTLLGDWKDSSDHLTFRFEKSGEQGYSITLSDGDKDLPASWVYQGHLLRLGDQLFLDAVFEEVRVKDKNLSALVLAGRVHVLVQVQLEGDALRMTLASEKWFAELGTKHEETEDEDVLLTAPTDELQVAVRTYALTHSFAPDLELKRDK